MSTYYYLYASGTNEYFELTSRSWYIYMEDMFDILIKAQKYKYSFKEFLDRLKSENVFDGFYDERDADFLTEENVKYFFKPLYDWSSVHKEDTLQIITDYELYDIAVKFLCKDKHLEYKKESYDEYSQEIEQEIEIMAGMDSWDGIVKHYMKMIGSIFYEDYKGLLSDIGVPFSRVISELKSGSTIWRKSDPTIKYKIDTNGILIKIDSDNNNLVEVSFDQDAIFAEDWSYELQV